MPNTIRQWLYGFFAAVIGAAATAASSALMMPNTFDPFTKPGWVNIARISIVPAILHGMLYLKQSPVPGMTATIDQSADSDGVHVEKKTTVTTSGS